MKPKALIDAVKAGRTTLVSVIAAWSAQTLHQMVLSEVEELDRLETDIAEARERLAALGVELEDADASQPPADTTAEDSRPEGVPSDVEEEADGSPVVEE